MCLWSPEWLVFFLQARKAIYTFGCNFLSSLYYYGSFCVHCLTDWLLLYPCWSLLRSNMYLRRGGGSMIGWCESNCFVEGSQRQRERPLNSCVQRKRSKICIKFWFVVEVLCTFLFKLRGKWLFNSIIYTENFCRIFIFKGSCYSSIKCLLRSLWMWPVLTVWWNRKHVWKESEQKALTYLSFCLCLWPMMWHWPSHLTLYTVISV